MMTNWHSELKYNDIDFFPLSYVLDMAVVEIFLVDDNNNVKQLVLDNKASLDLDNITTSYGYKVTTPEDAKTYDELNRFFRFASYAGGYVTTTDVGDPLKYDQTRPVVGLDLQTGIPYTRIPYSWIDNPQYWTKFNSDSMLLQFFPLALNKPNKPDGSPPDPLLQWLNYRSMDGKLMCGKDNFVEQICKPMLEQCTTCKRRYAVISDSACAYKCGNPTPYCWMYPNLTYGMFNLRKSPIKIDGLDTWTMGAIDVNFTTQNIDLRYIDGDINNNNATLFSLTSKYKMVINLVNPNMTAINDMNTFMSLTQNNQLYKCCDPDLDSTSDTATMCKQLGFDSTNKMYNNKCVTAMNAYCVVNNNYGTNSCITYCNRGVDIDNNPINCDTIMKRNCASIPKNSWIDKSCSCFLPDWAMEEYWNKLGGVPGSNLAKKIECEYIPCTSSDINTIIQRNVMRTGKQNCNSTDMCINSANIKIGGTITANTIDINQYAECVKANLPSPTPTPSPSPTPVHSPVPSPVSPSPTPTPSPVQTIVRNQLETYILKLKPKSWTMTDDNFLKLVLFSSISILFLICLFFIVIILI
jgi:hypothetical protein